MGDIADMMIDGTLCTECGTFIEEGTADGIPRHCSDCLSSVTTGVGSGDSDLAREIADVAGLRFRECTEYHYQIEPKDKTWLLNIYPSKQRLYPDQNRQQKPPYVKLGKSLWTFVDVVRATIAAIAIKEPPK